LRGVRHFISNSYHTRDAWIRRGIKPSKVDVVYNGIDTSLFLPHIRENSIHREWGIAEDERVLTFCGRLDIGKGIETLMRSFSEIKPKENRTRLLIAGKPLNHATYQAGQAYLKSLKQLSQQLGIHSEVTFLGHIRDTVELFQISDLVVLPSDLPESFGRTIIESMSCAVPALASDQGGTREILTGEFKKHLFPPRDSRGLARLLRQKINWRVTEPGLGDRCRRHVIDHFGLEHMIDGIESVLQKIIIKKQNQ
jgi:glycosyltransferase involved in cell wall biosynthesis